MTATETYYELLGVTESAPAEVITASYRALSKRLHPDRPGGDAARFALVNAAHDTLRDASSRATYDRKLADARTREQPAPVPSNRQSGSRQAPAEPNWGEWSEPGPEAAWGGPVSETEAPRELALPFASWTFGTGSGRTWLIGLLVSIGLAVAASQVMRDRAAPLTKLPEIAPGDIFVMLILGIAIASVLLARRADGTAVFFTIGTFWFWNQGGWAWAPDGRWVATASLLTASLVAALVATTALLQRD